MKPNIKKLVGVLVLAVCIFFTLAATFHQYQGNNDLKNVQHLQEYNLNQPDAQYSLPKELKEISALTDVDEFKIACVQDEKGIIYIYDLSKKKITNQYKFYDDGDYEGLTLVGKTMYVLRSNGEILKVENYDQKKSKTSTIKMLVPAQNNEGLCYDKKRNRLLVAAKSQPEHADKDTRAIYEFDLNTEKLNKQPVIQFDQELVLKQVQKVNPKLKSFHPSCLAVHPVTDQLYVLSANDPILAVFEHSGKLIHTYVLDKNSHPQPEGLTFLPNGDLLISNEGKGRSPVIYSYKRRQM